MKPALMRVLVSGPSAGRGPRQYPTGGCSHSTHGVPPATLLVLSVVAFALLALAVWGISGLSAAWPVLAIASAVLSTLLMVLLWNWQLASGVLIDVVLAAAAIARLSGVAFTSTGHQAAAGITSGAAVWAAYVMYAVLQQQEL